MNRLGMMVDISHAADKTFYDALETSQAPSDRLALFLPRRDQCPAQHDGRHDQRLAQKGGVIQINFNCGFVSQKSRCGQECIQTSAPVRATLADVVAHIDHAQPSRGHRRDWYRHRFRRHRMHARGSRRRFEIPEPDPRALEKGYTPADIKKIYWRQYAPADAASRESRRRSATLIPLNASLPATVLPFARAAFQRTAARRHLPLHMRESLPEARTGFAQRLFRVHFQKPRKVHQREQ